MEPKKRGRRPQIANHPVPELFSALKWLKIAGATPKSVVTFDWRSGLIQCQFAGASWIVSVPSCPWELATGFDGLYRAVAALRSPPSFVTDADGLTILSDEGRVVLPTWPSGRIDPPGELVPVSIFGEALEWTAQFAGPKGAVVGSSDWIAACLPDRTQLAVRPSPSAPLHMPGKIAGKVAAAMQVTHVSPTPGWVVGRAGDLHVACRYTPLSDGARVANGAEHHMSQTAAITEWSEIPADLIRAVETLTGVTSGGDSIASGDSVIPLQGPTPFPAGVSFRAEHLRRAFAGMTHAHYEDRVLTTTASHGAAIVTNALDVGCVDD